MRCTTLSVFVFLTLLLCAYAAEPNLAKKADVFHADMLKRFVIDGQLAPKLRHAGPVDGVRSYNMPDNAYMTGLYTGILSMKHAVTKEASTLSEAGKALDALHDLCTQSGIPGLLARAVVSPEMAELDDGNWQPAADGKRVWRTDVSSDQMVGVLYAFATAFDTFANDAQKKRIAQDAAALMDRLMKDGYRIIDYNGEPTEWGNYTEEYVTKTEPMNALILLQHLKVAHHVTGDAKYATEYERLAREKNYARLTVQAYQWRGERHNYSDDVLLWLAYEPLLRLEEDRALIGLYTDGVRRAWKSDASRKGLEELDSPLFAFLAAKYLGDSSGVPGAKQTLEWFPLEMKWNRPTIDAYAREFNFTFDPAPRSPEPRPAAPVPVDRRGKSWSAWVHTPFEAGDNDADFPGAYNGHDFLFAYWLGRYYGLWDG